MIPFTLTPKAEAALDQIERDSTPEQFTKLDDGRVLGGDGWPIPELTDPKWEERQEQEAGS